jgi:hypothetical protein
MFLIEVRALRVFNVDAVLLAIVAADTVVKDSPVAATIQEKIRATADTFEPRHAALCIAKVGLLDWRVVVQGCGAVSSPGPANTWSHSVGICYTCWRHCCSCTDRAYCAP